MPPLYFFVHLYPQNYNIQSNIHQVSHVRLTAHLRGVFVLLFFIVYDFLKQLPQPRSRLYRKIRAFAFLRNRVRNIQIIYTVAILKK
jgi:hypothetical protein